MKAEVVVHHKPRGKRVELRLDGQPVSWAELPYHRLRIGRAVLTVGGVADVLTKREHRMKGYSRRVTERSVELFAEDGLDAALLFGIPSFYDKFGFRTTLSDYEVSLAARTVIGGPLAVEPRTLPKRRHGDILPLYHKALRRRGFGIERPAGKWPGFHRGVRTPKVKVTAFTRRRRMVGYAVCDANPEQVQVGELVAEDSEVLTSVLTWLGRQCRRKLCPNIVLHLPADHPASRLAAELGATLTRKTRGTGGGMMRILNLGSTMAALMKELAARWSASPLAPGGLDLTFRTDIGMAELAIPARERSAALVRSRLRMPQNRLIQLITGYTRADDLAERPHVTIPRTVLPALAVLFPERHATILSTNCF